MALSQLSLDHQEKAKLSADLDSIISFIEAMNQVSTEDVEPLAHALDLTQTLRPAVAVGGIDRSAFQRIAPETSDGFYLVPKVLQQR